MDEKPNYYAIIPANIRYDTDLRANAKLMYGEITALSSKYGECTASNNYFARLYEVDASSISKWINQLKDKKYIEVDYEKNGNEIERRIIKIMGIDKYQYLLPKSNGGYCQKSIENNTSNNNTSKKEIYKERFRKPTLEEVEEYCNERNKGVDAKKFFDYYEVSNWTDSKGNKVKNWKQKVITWEKHITQKETTVPKWLNQEIKEERDEGYEDFLKGIEGYDK